MEYDLDRLTVKQKIKELMKWQENKERSFQNKDASDLSGTGINILHVDNKVKDNQCYDLLLNEAMENYDKLPLPNIEGKTENNDSGAISVKPKKPFLKKGAGLARYKMSPNTVSYKKPKHASSSKKDSVPNKFVADSKQFDPAISNDFQSRTDEMQVVVPNKQDEITKWADVLQKQSETSQREADELRIFEMMEEKAAESSFCSSSSIVAKFMGLTVRSTPKKNKTANDRPVFITRSETLKLIDLSCSKKDNVNRELNSSSDGDSDFASSDCDSEKSSCSLTSEGRMILSLIDKYRDLAILDGDLDSQSFSNIAENNVGDLFYRMNQAHSPVKITEIKDAESVTSTCNKEVELDNFVPQSTNEIDGEIRKMPKNAPLSHNPSRNEGLEPISFLSHNDEDEDYPTISRTTKNDVPTNFGIKNEDKSKSIKTQIEDILTNFKTTQNEDLPTNIRTSENPNKNEDNDPTNISNNQNSYKLNTDSVDGLIPNGASFISGSCNFQFYMKKIQEELKNLENETERVRQVRGKYDEEYRKFKKEKETFLRSHENERRLFEIEIEEERKKLQKERAVFERHSKPLRNKPALAQENEIKMLQEKILKLQDELKEKQKHWAISQSSVRSQLHSLVEANKTLRQEMIVMKDRERKLLEKEKRKAVHSYRQKSQFKNVNEHLEAVNEVEFEPPAIVECFSPDNPSATNENVCIIRSNIKKASDKNGDTNKDDSFPVEKPLKIVHPNGDIQITYDDGTNHYYFLESRVWHKKYIDGLEFVVFDDGQIEMKFEDGTREVAYPNGCRKLFVVSGDEVWCYKNGDCVIVKRNGDRVLAFASGEIEIHRKDFKLKQYPDSSCKYLYSNGVTETRYPDGRVRVKDKEGNLLKDNKQDLTQQCIKLLDKNMVSESTFIHLNGMSDRKYLSVTLHTDVGDLKVELFCEACPKACENFLALCASDYYNGCSFHRNIKGFIVQTGDPTDTGKGGNSIWGKKFEDEFKDNLKHSQRGMLSMANNGPNTNASQFFISYAAQPHLDLKYTLFGKIIDGFDALDELEKLPVNPKNYKPLSETRINSVTIHANPLAG